MFSPLFIYGAAQSGQAAADAEDAQREARRAKSATEMLRCDVERLLMITEALWTILKQQHGFQDEDLARLVTEIDLRDGKLDGRVAPSGPRTCPHCNHALGKARPFCYYCGQPVEVKPFER